MAQKWVIQWNSFGSCVRGARSCSGAGSNSNHSQEWCMKLCLCNSLSVVVWVQFCQEPPSYRFLRVGIPGTWSLVHFGLRNLCLRLLFCSTTTLWNRLLAMFKIDWSLYCIQFSVFMVFSLSLSTFSLLSYGGSQLHACLPNAPQKAMAPYRFVKHLQCGVIDFEGPRNA